MPNIDFHAHILPRLDHGCDSAETMLRQLAAAQDADVSVVVSTSHFYQYKQSLTKFLARREATLKALSESYSGPIRIVPASEVYLTTELASHPKLEELCIGDTNYIFIEMPHSEWTGWEINAVYDIIVKRGLRPVMAHVDRYPEKGVRELLQLDVLAQVNVDALNSLRSRKRILRMIDEGKIDVIGSDVHTDLVQYKRFKKAILLLGEERSKRFFENSMNIIEGKRISK